MQDTFNEKALYKDGLYFQKGFKYIVYPFNV